MRHSKRVEVHRVHPNRAQLATEIEENGFDLDVASIVRECRESSNEPAVPNVALCKVCQTELFPEELTIWKHFFSSLPVDIVAELIRSIVGFP